MNNLLFNKVWLNIDLNKLIKSFIPLICINCNINMNFLFLIGKNYKCKICDR